MLGAAKSTLIVKNVTDSPALSLPSGFSKGSLPLALLIVGRPFGEALVHRVAHAYEQATPWVTMHPDLA